MIPHLDVLVSFPAADDLGIKPYDMNCVSSEGDQTKEAETVGRRTADRPCMYGIIHWIEGGIGPGNILKRLKLLQFLKNSVSVCREDGCFLDDHCFPSPLCIQMSPSDKNEK